MAIAGRVAIVPQGEWSADATYKRLDAVTHNNTLYFAKKEVPAGTATSNAEYWSKSIVGSASAIATTEEAGIVKPDGTTITIDGDGTIHGQSEITVDGTTITLDEAKGIISLAKTLQDKINTIDDKLPSTSVVNNNTTTESGFALDARQANPNIEGTMAANILQLNNDSILSGNLGLGDFETKSMKLKPGFYIFINGHIFSPQITTLIVTADLPLRVDNILQPTSGHEVEISETDGVHTKITFSAKGGCRGHLYDMHIYY